MGYWLISELLRTIDVMPYLTFKFATYATIACHATFSNNKLLCCPSFPILSSSFVKKRRAIWSNPLLKSGMNRKPSFKVAFFKTSCPEEAFFKIHTLAVYLIFLKE